MVLTRSASFASSHVPCCTHRDEMVLPLEMNLLMGWAQTGHRKGLSWTRTVSMNGDVAAWPSGNLG